jgi:two-component system alkaline phosphatase synthesis response regulator PhoP
VVQEKAPESQFVFGRMVVNLGSYVVLVDEETVELTFSEFELLRRFCEEPDKIIDYETLCLGVWKAAGPQFKRRLAVSICRIRAKLGNVEPYRLETVRGRGYGLLRRREKRAANA